MILSKQFVDMLAMLSKINSSLALLPGDRVRVMNKGRSHIFSGQYPEGVSFDEPFNIFDVNDFIRAAKIVGVGCEMQVTGKSAVLVGTNNKLTYFGCDESLVEPVTKDINVPSVDATVTIPKDVIHDAISAAKTLDSTHLTFESKAGVQRILVSSIGIDGSPSMEITVSGDADCSDFSFVIPAEVFTVPADDYVLEFCAAGLAVFKTENGDTHAIGVEVSETDEEGANDE